MKFCCDALRCFNRCSSSSRPPLLLDSFSRNSLMVCSNMPILVNVSLYEKFSGSEFANSRNVDSSVKNCSSFDERSPVSDTRRLATLSLPSSSNALVLGISGPLSESKSRYSTPDICDTAETSAFCNSGFSLFDDMALSHPGPAIRTDGESCTSCEVWGLFLACTSICPSCSTMPSIFFKRFVNCRTSVSAPAYLCEKSWPESSSTHITLLRCA
mmetsp:Transcript_10236/g.27179  ORF Transcript_10236/g.27179 Transcript_10236/m.27179 type:complete len:214 (-) Transcript_10236:1831-2472(-)